MKQCDAIIKGLIIIPLMCCLQVGVTMAARLREQTDIEQTQRQRRKVTGIVLDATSGEAILGASVIAVEGKSGGAITNAKGEFTLELAPESSIEVSYLGYKTTIVNIGNQTRLTIRLESESQMVEEVVVTAFGATQKKESIVGSVQTINPTALAVPSANLSTSFPGRLSGVIAYQRSGEPGSNGANFYIRGISTLSGITSPLIILDGVEISSGDLNALDTEVIESFSILKDATATAMYGTRGANGVMIVKTKSGADLDRPVIGIRVENYITTPTKIPQFVDGGTYMRMFNEAVTNQGTGDVLFTADQIYGTENNINPYIYPNVDWYNEIFKSSAENQRINFNIRGGTSKITYFMNMVMNHETGMLRDRSGEFFSYNNNIDYTKFAFQNNIDFKVSPTSTISLHLNTQLNNKRGPNQGTGAIYSTIMNTNPVDFPTYFPASYDQNVNWVMWGAFVGGNSAGASNPLAVMTDGYSTLFESTVIANLDFDQKLDFITPGLSFKALASFKNWSRTDTSRSQNYNRYRITGYKQNADGGYDYTLSPMGTPTKPILGYSSSTNGDRRIYLQSYLDYTRQFGKNYVNAMLLYNQDQYNTNVIGSFYDTLPQRKMGFAARATYDYDHRYMIEFNAGYNGSENFAKGHRWGFFPSAAIGWNISSEPFWEPLKETVTHFKLRASYGLVGNDQIGSARFIYLAQVTLQNGDLGYTTGYGNNKVELYGPTYDRYQNEDITWEIGRKFNGGVDLQLYNDLNLSVDIFREIRSNIFQQQYSIPNYLGTAGSTIYGNLAAVRNQGVDIALDYNHAFNRDFAIQFKSTFTYATNVVLEYDEGMGVRKSKSQVGKSLNLYWGYQSDGLYIDEADIAASPKSTLTGTVYPGDIKYKDQPDNDGVYDNIIDANDQVAMGYSYVPEIVYGFGPSIVYKHWDFSFFFQGAAHTSIMMSGFHPFGTGYNRNVLQYVADDYWSLDNQNPGAAYPRLAKYDNGNNTATSDFWLRDGSFLKLKNIELGCSFGRCRIYVSATNLLTFSPFKYWDPEMGSGSGLQYPTQCTYNIGLSMSFK